MRDCDRVLSLVDAHGVERHNWAHRQKLLGKGGLQWFEACKQLQLSAASDCFVALYGRSDCTNVAWVLSSGATEDEAREAYIAEHWRTWFIEDCELDDYLPDDFDRSRSVAEKRVAAMDSDKVTLRDKGGELLDLDSLEMVCVRSITFEVEYQNRG